MQLFCARGVCANANLGNPQKPQSHCTRKLSAHANFLRTRTFHTFAILPAQNRLKVGARTELARAQSWHRATFKEKFLCSKWRTPILCARHLDGNLSQSWRAPIFCARQFCAYANFGQDFAASIPFDIIQRCSLQQTHIREGEGYGNGNIESERLSTPSEDYAYRKPEL